MNIHEYTRKYTNIHEYTRICTTAHEEPQTYTNTHAHSRIYTNMHESTRIYTRVRVCARDIDTAVNAEICATRACAQRTRARGCAYVRAGGKWKKGNGKWATLLRFICILYLLYVIYNDCVGTQAC